MVWKIKSGRDLNSQPVKQTGVLHKWIDAKDMDKGLGLSSGSFCENCGCRRSASKSDARECLGDKKWRTDEEKHKETAANRLRKELRG